MPITGASLFERFSEEQQGTARQLSCMYSASAGAKRNRPAVHSAAHQNLLWFSPSRCNCCVVVDRCTADLVKGSSSSCTANA